jgi:hypothetical protein
MAHLAAAMATAVDSERELSNELFESTNSSIALQRQTFNG